GKSLIEDIRVLTGLRTTLVTANIMAATENSIDQKIIELNVGEMNNNAQQLIDQVKNAFTEKRIMRYDNNPLNVQRDLIQKSLTFVPKGIKGLQDGLTINTEHKSTGAIQPDRDLLEQLNSWIALALRVPKSTIDKVGDEEFARSIVTTNLFFNNRVKIYQQDVNEQSTKLMRQYVKYNTPLLKKIRNVLALSAKDYDDTKQDPDPEEPGEAPKEPKLDASHEAQAFSDKQVKEAQKLANKIRKRDTNPPKSEEDIEMNDKNVEEQLQDILDHIVVKLPEPRIVVDKAQTEEINAYLQCIDGILNTVYSDDLLPDDYAAYHNVLHMFRARERARLVREFIKKVGHHSTFDLPALDQLDTTDLYTVPMFLINSKRGMDNLREQVAGKINMGNRVQNPGMMDTSGGMGNDFGLGSLGGNDMGGGGTSIGGELGGMGEPAGDMNMGGGSDVTSTTPATAGSTPGGTDQGSGMPNIDFNV
ncbi:MAG: hypothetical protein J5614_05820, partial [Paludibacteraceae bacterium]|nr:hypothetical protein [Paludibacteraceae bacterium]